MTDREAMYQSVLAHPDADLPRLVFADWLEENGEDALAVFIRVQCELARLPKWHPVWINAGWVDTSWLHGYNRIERVREVAGGATVDAYRRGFPWQLRVTDLPGFLPSGDSVFNRHPIGGLDIDWRDRPDLSGLASAPWLSKISRLDFHLGEMAEADIRPLLESERATRLDELHFQFGGIAASGLTALLRSPLARQLRELRLRGNFFGDHGRPAGEAFGDRVSLPALERLDLTNDRMPGGVVIRVLESLAAPKLARLELADCRLGPDGARLLAGCAKVSTVESLNLAKTEPGANGMKSLAASSNLGSLRILKLSSNRLGPVAVKAMVAAPWFAGLRVLGLNDANISDSGAVVIANSPASANLHALALARNAITDPGAKALLDSPHLSSLIHLDLHDNEISPPLLAALRARFGGQVGWDKVFYPKKKR